MEKGKFSSFLLRLIFHSDPSVFFLKKKKTIFIFVRKTPYALHRFIYNRVRRIYAFLFAFIYDTERFWKINGIVFYVL